MWHEKRTITYTNIFIAAAFVLLVSRILVLTDNYNWFIDPVSLEILYLFFTVFVVIAGNKGKVGVRKEKYYVVLGILLAHTVLWGVVFVDNRVTEVVATQFRSQIMFVVILIFTVWAISQFQAEWSFLKSGYYALALVLFVQLVTNFSDVDLSNLASIFTAKDRTRANFGFGHYNALGTACVCVILLQSFIKIQGRNSVQKMIDCAILIMSVIMLLCSASRSAITGLLLYGILYGGLRLDHSNLASATIKAIKVLGIFVIGLLAAWVLFGLDANAFLVASQRSLLFTHTLPMFFGAGKVLLGLGYASNVAFASGQTPYQTYWLDNAYIYYLVSTGVLGLALLMVAVFLIGKPLYTRRKTQTGTIMFAAFVVYAYISLFEATLFNSGGLVNYIYIPWFLVGMSKQSFREIKEIEGKTQLKRRVTQ